MPVLKMRSFAQRRPLSLLAFGLFPLTAQAEVVELASTVVSATSTERTLKDAPASVAVITGEALSKRPVRNLEDERLGFVEQLPKGAQGKRNRRKRRSGCPRGR